MKITKQEVDDVTAVAAFLTMAEREDLMLNGVRATEAVEGFARLINVNVTKLRGLARDPQVDYIISAALR